MGRAQSLGCQGTARNIVKNLSAFLQKSHLGSALVGHLGFVTAHRMNLIGDHLGQQ